MKRQLTVALGLAVIATPAFATKARLEALGEDSFGSYYINDNRNIFLNPAKINDNKDLVTYEFGAQSSSLSNAADSAAAPRGMGGFTKSHGNMVYGLHFGDSSPSTGLIRGLTTAKLQEAQPWDLHVGGDAGIKWGASFTYENYDGAGPGAQARLASHGAKLRGGIQMGDLEAFAQVSTSNGSSAFNGNRTDGKAGLFLGAGYMVNNYKLFADWRNISTDYSATAGANGIGVTTTVATDDKKFNYDIIRVGVGRQERLNDRATMFVKAMATRTMIDDKGNAVYGSTSGKLEQIALPVNIGLEYAATSWLDLRASVVNNVYSNQNSKPKGTSKKHTHIANTAVRAGASLKFGEFSIDGLISTNDGTGAGTVGSTTGTTGALRTDSLMTRVAMIYRF